MKVCVCVCLVAYVCLMEVCVFGGGVSVVGRGVCVYVIGKACDELASSDTSSESCL